MNKKNQLITNPILTDGEVTLKPMTLADVEDHLAGDDEEQVKWIAGGKSTEESATNWILRNQESWQKDGPVFNFGIRDKQDCLIGMVEANLDYKNLDGVKKGEANIAYALYPKARGKGLMSKAITLMETFLAEKGLGATVIRVHPNNKASIAVPVRLSYVDKGQIITRDGETLRVFAKEIKELNKRIQMKRTGKNWDAAKE